MVLLAAARVESVISATMTWVCSITMPYGISEIPNISGQTSCSFHCQILVRPKFFTAISCGEVLLYLDGEYSGAGQANEWIMIEAGFCHFWNGIVVPIQSCPPFSAYL